MPAQPPHPNWASGCFARVSPRATTEFEKRMRELRLSPDNCIASLELRRWCEDNKNRCYIPEWLLKAWGIPVDPDLS
jgi:hypothetical protein